MGILKSHGIKDEGNMCAKGSDIYNRLYDLMRMYADLLDPVGGQEILDDMSKVPADKVTHAVVSIETAAAVSSMAYKCSDKTRLEIRPFAGMYSTTAKKWLNTSPEVLWGEGSPGAFAQSHCAMQIGRWAMQLKSAGKQPEEFDILWGMITMLRRPWEYVLEVPGITPWDIPSTDGFNYVEFPAWCMRYRWPKEPVDEDIKQFRNQVGRFEEFAVPTSHALVHNDQALGALGYQITDNAKGLSTFIWYRMLSPNTLNKTAAKY